MADVSKIKLPDNSEYNVKDYRIPGVTSSVTSGNANVVTSGGVYSALSDYVPKSGDVMDEDAELVFGTDDYVPEDTGYGVTISKEGIVCDDPEDGYYMSMDNTSGTFLTGGTEYSDGAIASVPGNDRREYSFPDKSGTFALTSDLPTGLPSVSASDNGKVMQVVNGSWSAASVVIPTYYTGSSNPSSSLGSDGDIYLKISS